MRLILGIMTVAAGLAFLAQPSHATPSTTYWTPATLDFQPPGKTHVTYDTYTTISSDGPGNGGENFPIDYGLTWGSKIGKLNAEYGFDYLAPADDPLYFNAKFGYAEGVLSPTAPAVQIGLVNFGTRNGVTNQNIVHLIVGKSLPNKAGRVSGSIYTGNGDVLRSSSGDKENSGFMLAYDKVLSDKFIFAADYASGENAIGGGGFGVYYLFSPNASLLAGPVWFNDEGLNGKTKFTLQLDVNF